MRTVQNSQEGLNDDMASNITTQTAEECHGGATEGTVGPPTP